MIEVVVTDELTDWYTGLTSGDSEAVYERVELLKRKGLALGDPFTSAIKGAAFALREVKVQSGGRPIRILYAFDPLRQAVLLLGGDKTGDKRFYEREVPRAGKIWDAYLRETGQKKKT